MGNGRIGPNGCKKRSMVSMKEEQIRGGSWNLGKRENTQGDNAKLTGPGSNVSSFLITFWGEGVETCGLGERKSVTPYEIFFEKKGKARLRKWEGCQKAEIW